MKKTSNKVEDKKLRYGKVYDGMIAKQFHLKIPSVKQSVK